MAAVCSAAWLATGCGGDDSPPSPATGGTGGGAGSSSTGGTGGGAGSSSTGGTGGGAGSSSTGGGAGEAGAAGAAGTDCGEGDSGDLAVTIAGLPEGIDADVTLSGPGGDEELESSAMLSDVATGTYSISASEVADDDPLVRTLYRPGPESSVCVAADSEAALEVEYSAVAPSNKLWVLSDGSARVQGFASSSLTESNDEPATVALDIPAGIDLAFEPSGELWVVGATVSDPHLLRYSASELGASGEPEPDREIVIDDLGCIPSIHAIAFDHIGQLWVSACGDTIYRLTPDDLASSGTRTAEVVLSGVTENRDIALDADGNLWAASDGAAVRYDSDRLDASDSEPPDAILNVRNAPDTQDISVDYLTFDESGNLWVTDFGGNFIAQLPAADLADGGERIVVSASSLTLSVSALLNRPAFDGEGGLWISYSAGRIARVAPADLLVSTGAGDPTTPEVILSGPGIGNTANVAFFPAPSGLPLYHAWP